MHYGTSPQRWLLARRMEKATTLLRQPGCTVSGLSDELEYENISSFSQSFKQFYGMSPKHYQVAESLRGLPSPLAPSAPSTR